MLSCKVLLLWFSVSSFASLCRAHPMLPAEEGQQGSKRDRNPSKDTSEEIPPKKLQRARASSVQLPPSHTKAAESNVAPSLVPANFPPTNLEALSMEDLWNLAGGKTEWYHIHKSIRREIKAAKASSSQAVQYHAHHHFHHLKENLPSSRQYETGSGSGSELPNRIGLSPLPPFSSKLSSTQPISKLPDISQAEHLSPEETFWQTYGPTTGRSYYLAGRKFRPGVPNKYNLLSQVQKARKPFRDSFDYEDPDRSLVLKMAASSKEHKDTFPPLAWPWLISDTNPGPDHWTNKISELDVGRVKKFIKKSFTNSEAELGPYLQTLDPIELFMFAQVKPDLQIVDSVLKKHSFPVQWTREQAAKLKPELPRPLRPIAPRQPVKNFESSFDMQKGKRPFSGLDNDKGKRPKES